jgi:hypothetical protein
MTETMTDHPDSQLEMQERRIEAMTTSMYSINFRQHRLRFGNGILRLLALIALADCSQVSRGQDAPTPPAIKISNKLLGWDQSNVQCKFQKDLYDKIITDPAIPKETDKIDAFVKSKAYEAIAIELQDRPEKLSRLSSEEKAWSDYLNHPDYDGLTLVTVFEANSEQDVKTSISSLIEAVKKKVRPDCDSKPPVGLSVTERKNVFDALASEIEDIAKKYAKEEPDSIKPKILTELMDIAPEKIALELKKRSDAPADLSAKTIKSDFVFDIANLRTNLKRKLEGFDVKPAISTEQTPKPTTKTDDQKLERITKFKERIFQFIRTASFVQSFLAQFGIGGLEGYLAKTIIESLTEVIGEELRPEEKDEAAKWASALSMEFSNRNVSQVMTQQPQTQFPNVILPQQPIIWGYGGRWQHHSHHKGRVFVVPAGSFSSPASGVFMPSSGMYFVR